MVGKEGFYRLKNEDTEIPLGIFTNDSYKEISAIVFSTTGTLVRLSFRVGSIDMSDIRDSELLM